MNCPACGREYDPTAPTCPYCQKTNPFQILPPETGAAGGSLPTAPEAYHSAAEPEQTAGPQPRVLIRQINLGSIPGGPFTRLLGGGLLMVLAVLLLPILILMGILWSIFRLLRPTP